MSPIDQETQTLKRQQEIVTGEEPGKFATHSVTENLLEIAS